MKTVTSMNEEVKQREVAIIDNEAWQAQQTGSEPQLARLDRLRHFGSLRLTRRRPGRVSGPLVLAFIMVIGALAVTDSSSVRESQQLDIAPASSGLSIDGAQPAYCGSTSYTSCTAHLTTSKANDLIIAFCTVSSGSLTPSIQDSGGHNWRIRDYNSADPVAYEWYTTASSPLTSDAITCSTTSDININLIVFGVSGANLNAPFDPSPSFPYTNAGTGGTPSVGVELATSPDLVLGLIAEAGGPGCGYPSDGSGFSTITMSGNPPCNVAEYAATSATGSYTVDFGSVGSRPYSFFADAIESVTTPGVALDGVATGYCSASTWCVSSPLSTDDPGDLMVAFCTVSSSTITPGVSDTGYQHPWAQRAFTYGNPRGFEFYSTSPSPLNDDSVVCSTSSPININLIVFAISGANLNAPFDSSGSFPYATNGTVATPSESVTQSFTDDFLFGLIAEGGGNGCSYPTLGLGFMLIASSGYPPCNVGEFEETTGAGSYVVDFGSTNSRPYPFIVDDVEAAPTPDAPVTTLNTYAFESEGTAYGTMQLLGVTYADDQTGAIYEDEAYSVTATASGFTQWLWSGGTIGSATAKSTTFTPTSQIASLSVVPSESQIWGGYLQSGASITKVSASMVVPAVTWDSVAQSTGTETVAFWVGVGGISGTTNLWQTGIEFVMVHQSGGGYTLYLCAFYEYATSPSSPLTCDSYQAVGEGDTIDMTVVVNAAAENCYFAVNDTSTGVSTDGSVTGCDPDVTTADIVAENPGESCIGCPAHYPTLNFGTPTIFSIEIQDGSTLWTLLNGPLMAVSQTISPTGGSETLQPDGIIANPSNEFVLMKTGA